MLINKDGSIDYNVEYVITSTDRDKIKLDDNQFLQYTPTGKRLELWEGKKEYLQNGVNADMHRIKYWNERSVLMML